MKTFKLALLLCVATLSWFGGDQAVKADYGDNGDLVVIVNSTNVEIPFEIQWGAGSAWRTFRVAPGERLAFVASPVVPAIRFDAIAGDNQVTYKAYQLESNVGYAFQFSADGRTLELVEDEFFTNE